MGSLQSMPGRSYAQTRVVSASASWTSIQGGFACPAAIEMQGEPVHVEDLPGGWIALTVCRRGTELVDRSSQGDYD